MANTLKFGNGQWATKVGSTLAYNNEGGNFKPLPFNFTRSTSGTRVNKDGLIEVVTNNKPRIDFLNDANGALLLEPSRTNLVTNSSEFTGGLIGVSILRDVETSPDGNVSADKLLNNSASGEHLINSNITLNMVSGTSYTCSAFFKSDGTGGQGVIRYYNGSTFHYGVFNLENGDVSYNSSGTSKIEEFPNGWYRCSISFTSTGAYPNPPLQIGVGNALNQFSYQGASNLSHYFWGVQYEAGSYATSYIPTQGSIGTRVAEVCNGAGNAQVFNDSEGVLFAEISGLANDGTSRVISINDGGSSDYIHLRYHSVSNTVRFIVRSGDITSFDYFITLPSTEEYNKIAIKYDNTNVYLWANGFEYFQFSPITTPIGLSTLDFDDSLGNNDFYGKTKQIAYYDEILTDLELEYMTSYRSLNEMVTELNLNAL